MPSPTLTTLVNFNFLNGSGPSVGLTADAAGNLFGTTSTGGTNNDGTVFEIVQNAGVYASTPTILVNFSYNVRGFGADASGLITDSAGNLFGTTGSGGDANGDGTVYEIVKTAGVYAGTLTTLVSFNGTNGSIPTGLIADAAGNFFGTTTGGANGYGGGLVRTAMARCSKSPRPWAVTPPRRPSWSASTARMVLTRMAV
jgi:uncharacterized repeat protein (TIGR03803 family)